MKRAWVEEDFSDPEITVLAGKYPTAGGYQPGGGERVCWPPPALKTLHIKATITYMRGGRRRQENTEPADDTPPSFRGTRNWSNCLVASSSACVNWRLT